MTTTPAPQTLSWLDAHGSHHEIGRALGQWGARACQRYLVASPAWAQVMAFRSHPGIATMQGLVHHHFPWIEHELMGLAEGLGLSYEEVFLWNCRGDLWALAPDGCTTVLAAQRLSHNEDGDPGFAGACGLVKARPIDAPAFVSFIYPGSLPGHTFAVTQTGMAITVNNIRARQAQATGLPRMVLTRALLTAQTPAQAVQMLQSHPRMGAFHLGIGQAASPCSFSVEFTQDRVSVQPVRQGRRLHANHAIHEAQQALAQVVTASSAHRQARGDALLAEDADALDILRDTQDTAEPILRRAPGDTDQENTLATADIDLTGDLARWDVYAPGAREPHYTFHGLKRLAEPA
ncbi:C45 family autoproteolytic acyltransferase/hydolase [Castellaniella caeni]|uniref:C45 family autoproteolytic acyltransferase/hydolase n=1 Tax=Castellaniella caeni TaxID=266123 RepID=UPI00083526FF|nr:C45 family peptidase [Castellaniella caeni]